MFLAYFLEDLKFNFPLLFEFYPENNQERVINNL